VIVYHLVSNYSAISWLRRSCISMRWWWCQLCTRPTC